MTREYTRREVFESVGDVVAQATRIPAQKIANIHLSRRDFIRLSALGLVLARCTTPPSEPTDSPPAQANVPPTLQVEPTPVPIPTPTVYGETIVGSSLEIGGASLELKTRLAQELADLTGAKDRGWLVVADNEGRSSCFIGEADGEQVAVLGQGPSGYEWDGEAGIWKTPDYLNIVVPDVTLPGGWNEETGRAGPRASAEFTFMVEYGDQPKVVVLYSADTIAEMQGSGSSEEQGIEVLSDGSGMWVGESKRVSLDGGQGETVVRDSETGTLSVINNQGGLVRSMVVRWSEAKSPEEALQVGSWVAVVVAVEEAVETPTIEGATILMEVSHTYDEEVMGVPVQFTIGLHPGLVNASEFPIKDVVT
ncbi:hypothetical protein KKB40_06055, partial [Patescibacteria group bacterium]|nr:hypothetical protein [Patescibacteria group bacterium]